MELLACLLDFAPPRSGHHIKVHQTPLPSHGRRGDATVVAQVMVFTFGPFASPSDGQDICLQHPVEPEDAVFPEIVTVPSHEHRSVAGDLEDEVR